jgi:UDP-glucose:(heptosyl)LPS alpha-1,3-glucosyltransferase
VAFPGKVEDMPAFYNAGDIFCLASFYDACSNAVVEALACGSRVLSSASNGSAAFLDPGHVFADPGDAAALAALIERTAAEPRPGPFAWPEGLVSGLEPYLELAAERLAAKAGRGRPS